MKIEKFEDFFEEVDTYPPLEIAAEDDLVPFNVLFLDVSKDWPAAFRMFSFRHISGWVITHKVGWTTPLERPIKVGVEDPLNGSWHKIVCTTKEELYNYTSYMKCHVYGRLNKIDDVLFLNQCPSDPGVYWYFWDTTENHTSQFGRFDTDLPVSRVKELFDDFVLRLNNDLAFDCLGLVDEKPRPLNFNPLVRQLGYKDMTHVKSLEKV
ncbi:unnamed protein product [Sphagnum balticum]